VELNQLYQFLKSSPRDTRWMIRRVGPEFRAQLAALRAQGRPVTESFMDVEGKRRLVYRAADQVEIGFTEPGAHR
jgi:hypothetical protein